MMAGRAINVYLAAVLLPSVVVALLPGANLEARQLDPLPVGSAPLLAPTVTEEPVSETLPVESEVLQTVPSGTETSFTDIFPSPTGTGTPGLGDGFEDDDIISEPSCNVTLRNFWNALNKTCDDIFNDLECHSLILQPHKRVALAQNVGFCSREAYQDAFGCVLGGVNANSGPIVVLDNNGKPQDVETIGEGDCDKPEYMSIFQGATDYYFDLSSVGGSGSGSGGRGAGFSTCCPVFDGPETPGSADFFGGTPSTAGQDTEDRLLRVFGDAPMHYARCRIQESGSVRDCVRRETDKLKWLPRTLPVLYGGQLRCPPTFAIMGPFIIVIVFELARIAAEVLCYRRGWLQDETMAGEKPKQFSWLSLVGWCLYAFGQPILTALALYRSSAGDALTLLMGVYALTPRAFSIVAVISGIWLSKGYGAQLLLIDSIIGIVSWSYFNGRFQFWEELRPPTSEGAPWYLGRFYKGIFLATFPSGILAFVYVISGFAIVGSIAFAIYLKKPAIAKLAGYVLGMWLLFFAWCATIPFFAVWEIGWKIYLKAAKGGKARVGEARVFPPVRWHRRLFSSVSSPHYAFRLGKHVLYWVWCLMQFVEFVGRWMAIVYLLPLLGDSFCPSKVAESAALYVLFGLFMMVTPFVLRYFGF